MHQSVATIDSPEFLNLQPSDINPLMSKCEIKVFYLGENRNHTFIDETVAKEMGKTLRGAPIVGYYRDSKEDFTDHGEKVIIDDEGIKFECQTIPYGFVSPNAEVWFQNFEDKDEMGNIVVHKYLMTTGYLWTSQFPESSLPVNEGRPQSMEFEKDSVKGEWKINYKNGIDFFIINDAIIQKLCILGDDVEPCFQGASVTAPNVSTSFTLDDNFKHTLYSMMQDLKQVLDKGGQQMDTAENTVVEMSAQIDDATSVKEPIDSVVIEGEGTVEYKKEEKNDDKDKEENSSEESPEKEEEKKDEDDNKKESESQEDEKKKESAKKYEILETELAELKTAFSALEEERKELLAFKAGIENDKKRNLIAEFYMLSDEDKKDVIENINNYSLDEIKAKLAVICFDKKVSFALEDGNDVSKGTGAVTYNLNETPSNLPDWVKAVKEQEKNS